ncbi:energy transducer TonB [Alkanindiges sp. WGS2144]|uniref:energy transducer TonB n=1 Tax=Alkanindiges sp. WGS2144 TaxID=3366808 RepID=UPI003750E72A
MAKQRMMTTHLVPAFWQDPVLMGGLVAAIMLHVGLLSLHFVAKTPPRTAMQDIAIAVHLSNEKVENADYMAQANQQGAGVLRNAHRMTSPDQQAASIDQQEVAEQLDLKTEQHSRARQASEQVLVTTLSWKKQARNLEREQESRAQVSSSPDLAQVAMIASLEAQYARRKQEYTRKTKIHTVDSVSAQADNTAGYIHKFSQKVEQLGNKHYPLEARARNLHGDVQLMVILTPHGQIRAIRLLQSSGHLVLDEAAKDSVRQAAPFGSFDQKMKGFSELRIIRTWRFSEKLDDLEVAS